MSTHPFLARAHEVQAYLACLLSLLVRPVWPQPPCPLSQLVATPLLWTYTLCDREWRCPFGVPGDALWWKEKWAAHFIYDDVPPRECCSGQPGDNYWYRADPDDAAGTHGCPRRGRIGRWRPSTNMPRWAVRPALRATPVVDVRLMQVQSISEADAIATGIASHDVQLGKHYNPQPEYVAFPDREGGFNNAKDAFECLWDSDNAHRPGCDFASNPWVWAVTIAAAKGGVQT